MRVVARFLVAAFVATATIPAAALAQVPGMGKQERYQDWTVFCPANTDCTAMFSGAAVRVVVGPNAADGALRVAVLVAANADASKPVIALLAGKGEDAPPKRVVLNIRGCSSGFCKALASAETAPQVIELFRTSRMARILYAIREGRTVSTRVSFDGFANALAEVEQQPR